MKKSLVKQFGKDVLKEIDQRKKILIAYGDSWTGGTHRDKPNSYP